MEKVLLAYSKPEEFPRSHHQKRSEHCSLLCPFLFYNQDELNDNTWDAIFGIKKGTDQVFIVLSGELNVSNDLKSTN